MSHEHEKMAEKLGKLTIDVCILSDSRTIDTDETGKWLKEKIGASDIFNMGIYSLIKNDSAALKELAAKFLKGGSDVLITSGGTGISARDITIDTLDAMFTKKLGGFGEIFRLLSFNEIGVRAIMSRAQAGLIAKKLVVCLPGSKNAVTMAYEKILLSQLHHLIYEATR